MNASDRSAVGRLFCQAAGMRRMDGDCFDPPEGYEGRGVRQIQGLCGNEWCLVTVVGGGAESIGLLGVVFWIWVGRRWCINTGVRTAERSVPRRWRSFGRSETRCGRAVGSASVPCAPAAALFGRFGAAYGRGERLSYRLHHSARLVLCCWFQNHISRTLRPSRGKSSKVSRPSN